MASRAGAFDARVSLSPAKRATSAAAAAASAVAAPSEREPAGSLAAPYSHSLSDDEGFGEEFDGDAWAAGRTAASMPKRAAPSVMGFGRRRDQEQVPVDIPELMDGVKVDVFVRCRPMFSDETKAGDKAVLRVDADEASVTMKSSGHGGMERYFYDGTFGPESSQEDVYVKAAKPIVDNVLRGMNCCMFAYGQTGTGKTHTTVGDLRDPSNAGIIPRAVSDLFSQLRSRGGPFKVSVSFLEVYNEQLMDLLIAPESARSLRLVEDPRRGVVCQNLSEVPVVNPDEIFALIAAGNRRCQVAATNMNERSNRAHRVFIITVAFSKLHHLGKGLREAESILRGRLKTSELDELGCLTIVDLAGSECVGRSGATDARLTEAGNINKSLLTLGRVINALANNEPRIPYRDSKLTRLVAEALGGRCKTAIIATVAPGSANAQESASTLKYAERARSALNATQLSKTQVLEAKLTRLAQMYKELQLDLQNEREMFEQERQLVQRTHAQHVEMLRKQRREEIRRIIESRDAVLRAQIDSTHVIQRTESVFLRSVRKTSSKTEATITRELQSILADTEVIKRSLSSLGQMSSEKLLAHSESVAALVSHLGARLKQLTTNVQVHVDKAVEMINSQRQSLDEFAGAEARAMKKTSEEMIQSLAKLLSRHVSAHSQRVQASLAQATAHQKDVIADVSRISAAAQSASASVANSVLEWSKESTDAVGGLLQATEEKQHQALQAIDKIREDTERCKQSTVADVRDIYANTVRHNAVIDAETRQVSSQVEILLRENHELHDDIVAESMMASPLKANVSKLSSAATATMPKSALASDIVLGGEEYAGALSGGSGLLSNSLPMGKLLALPGSTWPSALLSEPLKPLSEASGECDDSEAQGASTATSGGYQHSTDGEDDSGDGADVGVEMEIKSHADRRSSGSQRRQSTMLTPTHQQQQQQQSQQDDGGAAYASPRQQQLHESRVSQGYSPSIDEEVSALLGISSLTGKPMALPPPIPRATSSSTGTVINTTAAATAAAAAAASSSQQLHTPIEAHSPRPIPAAHARGSSVGPDHNPSSPRAPTLQHPSAIKPRSPGDDAANAAFKLLSDMGKQLTEQARQNRQAAVDKAAAAAAVAEAEAASTAAVSLARPESSSSAVTVDVIYPAASPPELLDDMPAFSPPSMHGSPRPMPL